MEKVEWDDVQCIVRRGVGWLKSSAFVLLKITDRDAARRWLRELPVTSSGDVARHGNPDLAVNIAFTFEGLCKLGFEKTDAAGFSREYREGMAPEPTDDHKLARRSSMLGDVGPNDPTEWCWGGRAKGSQPVHVLLLVFGHGDLTEVVAGLIGAERETGVEKIGCLPGWLPTDKSEHFGFRDSLSQPVIAGDSDGNRTPDQRRLHETATGEFLIGYRNERGNFPISPHLPTGADFGRNGVYLVLRQLQQHVENFEEWLDQAEQNQAEPKKDNYREWLAAKIMGRWRNGAPLTRYPDSDSFSEDFGTFDETDPAKANDFYFHAEDDAGFRCPIGSHIRRAWPRDGLGSSPERALLQSRMHRIIRRSRLYGPIYDRENRKAPENTKERGLLFLCLNADIAGQFEAVQANWLNNSKFSGLAAERDPLLGERDRESVMTIQESPVSLRLQGLEQYVTTRGGGYFFLPGLTALDRLTSLPEKADTSVTQSAY